MNMTAFPVEELIVIALLLQWTQNMSELELCHSKRGREAGKGKGEQDSKESV
jgi:hypothetical protein